MKPRTYHLASALLAFCIASAPAAPVTWSEPATITGDADVITDGVSLWAYKWTPAGGSQTVNGVTFTAPGTGLTRSSSFDSAGGYSGFLQGTAPPATSLSPAYQNVLTSATWSGASPGTGVITLNDLVVGREYKVQVWVDDSRGLGLNRAMQVTAGGGNTVTLSFPATTAGALGQFTVGTFTADGPFQDIDCTGIASPVQVNAIQLREIEPVVVVNEGTWNGLAGATWDLDSSANWCINAPDDPLSSGTFQAAMALSGDQAWFSDDYDDAGSPVAVTQDTVTVAAGGVPFDGTIVFDAASVNYTLDAADSNGLGGSATIVKTGGASLTLAGPNTWAGDFHHVGGTLLINHEAALGTGNLHLEGGALGTTSATPLAIAGDNPLSLRGSCAFTGGELDLGNGPVTLGGDVTLETQAGTLTLGGPMTATGSILTKQGSGTLVLAGDNSLGNLDVQDGTVTLDGGSYASNDQRGGWGLWVRYSTAATLNLTNGATVSIAKGFQIQQGTVNMDNGAIVVQDNPTSEFYLGNSTTDATLNMSGGSLQAPAMSFGNNGANATLNLTGGTIAWKHAPVRGSGNATLNMGGGTLRADGPFVVPPGLPFTLTGTNGDLTVDAAAGDVGLDNPLTGPGGLVKNGPGALVLGAFGNDYTGATTVNEGVLCGNGVATSDIVVKSGAALTAGFGAVGIMDAKGVAFEPGSVFKVKVDTDYGYADLLYAAGDVTIDGATLDLTVLGSALLAEGTEFVILDYTGGTLAPGSMFAGLPEGGIIAAGANGFTISYNDASQVTLTAVAGGYAAWAAQWANGQDLTEDHDGDGVPNGIEYFMGETGSGFTPGPAVDATAATWAMGASYPGTYEVDFIVQSSVDLVAWDDVPEAGVTFGPTSVSCALPPGTVGFLRLKVTGP